mgnify:CR=1 FL=1
MRALNHSRDLLDNILKTENMLMKDKVAWYRLVSSAIVEVRTQLEAVAERTAMNGVVEGVMSRRLAGEIIGVHQGTIARWLKEEPGENGLYPYFKADDDPAKNKDALTTRMTRVLTDPDESDDSPD